MKKSSILVAILACMGLCSGASQAQSFLNSSLIAYYPLDGNAKDTSGHGHDGVLMGTTAFEVDRFGNSNACLALPGTPGTGSGIFIPSLSDMPYRPVTYSAWYLIKDFPNGHNPTMTLVGRDQCGRQSQGALCIVWDQATGQNNQFGYFTGAIGYYANVFPATNTWGQVVLTIDDAGRAAFYLDGARVPGYGAAPAGPPMDFWIGGSAPGGCDNDVRQTWNGLIDDVRIYSRAFSASEVEELYQFESGVSPARTGKSPAKRAVAGDPESLARSTTSQQLKYQWKPGGTATSTTTSSSLSLSNVLVSQSGVSLGLYPGVTVTGSPGFAYTIQSTTNLSDPTSWISLTNLVLTQTEQLWIDTNVDTMRPENPHRFYQVIPAQ